MTRLRLGHSPDSDDAFMFWGLASGRVTASGLEFEHILRDIETLNQWALEGRLEITAVSAHAYAFVADRYLILPHGASMGDGYGPKVVVRQPIAPEELAGKRLAVPGKLTSAFLAFLLWWHGRPSSSSGEPPRYVVAPFDRIMEMVAAGEADAGLIIHEGQLTYGSLGLTQVLDLGEWWLAGTGLPLPLGLNVIRRDLPMDVSNAASQALRASILAGLENRREALEHALQFARGLPTETADQFVGMYVNDWTVDLGERGRTAVQRFLGDAASLGLVPPLPQTVFSA